MSMKKNIISNFENVDCDDVNIITEIDATRIYLNVPFSHNQYVKKNGCSFDFDKKKWYVLDNNPYKDEFIMKYTETPKKTIKQRIYLYVPYDYNTMVKEKGGLFDGLKKQWYIFDDNKNKDELIDTYHKENFKCDSYGYRLFTTTTKRMKKEKEENEKHDRLKKEWITEHGNDYGFGVWYSVNINNNE